MSGDLKEFLSGIDDACWFRAAATVNAAVLDKSFTTTHPDYTIGFAPPFILFSLNFPIGFLFGFLSRWR